MAKVVEFVGMEKDWEKKAPDASRTRGFGSFIMKYVAP